MKIPVRYSTLTNWRQCPLRVYLLSLVEAPPLFVAQYLGLYAHLWLERYLRNAINGEALSLDDEEVHREVTEGRTVNEEELPVMRKKAQELPLTMWGERVLEWMNSLGVTHIDTEVYCNRDIYHGTADIVAYAGDEVYIVDLKRSDYPDHYSSDQMNLYAYLLKPKLGKKKIKKAFLVFLHYNGLRIREYDLSKRGLRLKSVLAELKAISEIFDYELWEYIVPNPYHRTCHPNRCAVWDYCAAKDLTPVREPTEGGDDFYVDEWV